MKLFERINETHNNTLFNQNNGGELVPIYNEYEFAVLCDYREGISDIGELVSKGILSLQYRFSDIGKSFYLMDMIIHLHLLLVQHYLNLLIHMWNHVNNLLLYIYLVFTVIEMILSVIMLMKEIMKSFIIMNIIIQHQHLLLQSEQQWII